MRDIWQMVERSVTLSEGWNAITYGKGGNFAELDMIEVACGSPLGRDGGAGPRLDRGDAEC